MMPAYCLLDTMSTVNMPATSDIAVSDRIEAYCALKLVLKLLCAYSKTILVEIPVFNLHL